MRTIASNSLCLTSCDRTLTLIIPGMLHLGVIASRIKLMHSHLFPSVLWHAYTNGRNNSTIAGSQHGYLAEKYGSPQ